MGLDLVGYVRKKAAACVQVPPSWKSIFETKLQIENTTKLQIDGHEPLDWSVMVEFFWKNNMLDDTRDPCCLVSRYPDENIVDLGIS